jgi:CRP/FNR family transcriptional regulator
VPARESPGGSASTTEHDDLQPLIGRALPGCTPQTLASLTELARLRTVRSDEPVFRQGELIPLAIVIDGHCVFRRTTVDGQLLSIDVARPGDMFGFASIAAAHASIDLVALTDCEVALWRGQEIRQLVAADPGLALDVIDWMAELLEAITERIDGFLHQDARRRVMRVLSRHRDLFFGDPVVLSRSHLPSLVGTSREATGRVLRQLEHEGTLDRVGRTGLRLVRPDRLDA